MMNPCLCSRPDLLGALELASLENELHSLNLMMVCHEAPKAKAKTLPKLKPKPQVPTAKPVTKPKPKPKPATEPKSEHVTHPKPEQEETNVEPRCMKRPAALKRPSAAGKSETSKKFAKRAVVEGS